MTHQPVSSENFLLDASIDYVGEPRTAPRNAFQTELREALKVLTLAKFLKSVKGCNYTGCVVWFGKGMWKITLLAIHKTKAFNFSTLPPDQKKELGNGLKAIKNRLRLSKTFVDYLTLWSKAGGPKYSRTTSQAPVSLSPSPCSVVGGVLWGEGTPQAKNYSASWPTMEGVKWNGNCGYFADNLLPLTRISTRISTRIYLGIVIFEKDLKPQELANLPFFGACVDRVTSGWTPITFVTRVGGKVARRGFHTKTESKKTNKQPKKVETLPSPSMKRSRSPIQKTRIKSKQHKATSFLDRSLDEPLIDLGLSKTTPSLDGPVISLGPSPLVKDILSSMDSVLEKYKV